MTSNEILKADVLDILFDNRNKQYGAYVLRKNYNNRLGMALGISLSSVLLFLFLAQFDYSSGSARDRKEKDEVIITEALIPPIKKQEIIIPKQTTPRLPVKERTFVNLVIKDDKLVNNPMTTQDDLMNSLISNRNIDGPAVNNIPIIEPVVEKPTVKEEVKPIEEAPSREPEFPGGQAAWMNFLHRNLNAPSQLEPGEKKTVSIRFFVSVDGAITDFEVVQSAGKAFDSEVIRVLKKMPKWKPAIQNGQPIARAFTQPVTFVGMEE